MDNSCCAVVIGLCSHGLAISRALHRQGIEVHAFEANSSAPGFRTNSATVHQVRSINADSLIGDLFTFRSNFPADKKIVIYPTNDNNVRIIAEHIEGIKSQFIVSWAHCSSTIKNLLLKSNIESRCVETGLLYPKSRIAPDFYSLRESLSEIKSPFIVKPVKPQSSFKALKFQTDGSLLESLENYTHDFPVLVQEWIEGTAQDLYFCALYMDNGIPLNALVGRKLDSYPPALGQTTVAITHHDDSLINLTLQFFAGLDISGPVSVEFKRDREGNYWVIEPTVGRSDFWLGLCIAAGLDLPLVEYKVSTGEPQSSVSFTPPSKTIWFDSDRDLLAPIKYSSKWLSFSARAYKPVFSYFNLRDMLPFYRALSRTIGRLVSRLLKKNAA